jgi:hypothetical protein
MAVATMRERPEGVDGPAVALPNLLQLAANPQAWHSCSPAVEPGKMVQQVLFTYTDAI